MGAESCPATLGMFYLLPANCLFVGSKQFGGGMHCTECHSSCSYQLCSGAFFVFSAYDYVIPASGKVVALTDLQIALPPGCYGRVGKVLF